MSNDYRIGAIWITPYINPGWNRRTPDGSLEPLTRRQLVLHRILWGFNRLVYNEPWQQILLRGIAGVRPAGANWTAVAPDANWAAIGVGVAL